MCFSLIEDRAAAGLYIGRRDRRYSAHEGLQLIRGRLARGPFRHPREPAPDQAMEQAVPLRVNEVGLAALPVWVAWKPTLTEALGAMAAL